MKLTLLPRKRGGRRCEKRGERKGKGRTKGKGKDEREGDEVEGKGKFKKDDPFLNF